MKLRSNTHGCELITSFFGINFYFVDNPPTITTFLSCLSRLAFKLSKSDAHFKIEVLSSAMEVNNTNLKSYCSAVQIMS